MSIHSNIEKTLTNAERLNPTLNSFLSIEKESALERALELDNSNDDDLPVKGLAIAVKDNICTKGLQTTCGSNILGNYIAQYDAAAVEKLKNAGAVIIGKANMDEFAMGSSNESSAFGPVKNPWDIERVPGGSSGGSETRSGSPVLRPGERGRHRRRGSAHTGCAPRIFLAEDPSLGPDQARFDGNRPERRQRTADAHAPMSPSIIAGLLRGLL